MCICVLHLLQYCQTYHVLMGIVFKQVCVVQNRHCDGQIMLSESSPESPDPHTLTFRIRTDDVNFGFNCLRFFLDNHFTA